MQTFQRWIIVLSLLMLAGSAAAQLVPKGNIYFGYAYDHLDLGSNQSANANGWDAQLEGKLLPWVGIVGDLGGNYASRNFDGLNVDFHEYNFLFGPRISVGLDRVRPFGQLLIGASHISLSKGVSDSDTSFANSLGGGLDYKLAGPVYARGELDWIHTRFFSNGQNDVRFTLGLVLDF